jgi:hypothetical protein
MIKNIRVSVDQKSWTSPPPKYRKVFPFASLPPLSGIDFRRAMLWTGLMSVSPRMPQGWTASQWAILRYFGAVDGTLAALRLHSAVDEIDTHPKKVLSDDWGIGIGLEWLDSQFQYTYVQHGRRAIDELQALGIANFAGKKKRGPQKCPDFICTDRNGRYHIIECKGNQQGPDHIAVQFKQGIMQKANIRFKNEQLVAQRIVAGLAIANYNSSWGTTLRLTDPPPDSPYDETTAHIQIDTAQPQQILRGLKRATCMQGLLSSGLFELARRLLPETSKRRGLDEPNPEFPVTRFEANGSEWMGQEFNLEFPSRLRINPNETLDGIRLRFGTATSLIRSINKTSLRPNEESLVEDLDLDLVPRRFSPDGGTHTQTDDRSASIQQGNAFIAVLDFL